MGEVYLARDTRLDREVAIKVLPASVAADADRIRRFTEEARAVATLSHPNILAIHDIGQDNGVHYLVTELLKGESLRDALKHGPLSPRRSIEIAVQVSSGLAAAHQKGVVHRDLKPENIFLTRDGHAKILDFGLAKMQRTAAAAAEGATQTSSHTEPGTVMGTATYMAPEQVRGEGVDHRADIFSLGLILYEMLAGGPAFKRDSSVETMTAILKEDAPEFPATTHVPPAVERIVRRCLEKSPDQRFQSAKDMAFALEAMSGSSSQQRQVLEKMPRTRWVIPTLATAAIVALIAMIALFAMRSPSGAPTKVTQLTFRYGYIRTARFTPDGKGVVYGAMWDGGAMQVYQGRADSSDSQAIPTDKADLLSISKSGELALALNRRFLAPWVPVGTLARVPLLGGTPRPVFEEVLDADWSPDGSGLAIIYRSHGRFRLEYPIGKVLYENAGYLSHVRFSPDGKVIAFTEHPFFGDDRGWISTVDLSGKRQKLSGEYSSLQGVAWRPDGKEIWFGIPTGIQGVDRAGKERVVYLALGSALRLLDISADGKALVTNDQVQSEVFAATIGQPESRNLAVLPSCAAEAMSSDGKTIVMNTFQGDDYELWIRGADGSPAVQIGTGAIFDISPDGKTVLGLKQTSNTLELVPTGVGEPRLLPLTGVTYQFGSLLPDGRRAVLVGSEPGRGARLYVQDLFDKNVRRPISPEGVTISLWNHWLSVDGKYAIANPPASPDPDNPAPTAMLYPVAGGEARPVKGTQPGDVAVSWLADGSVLMYATGSNPSTVYKVDINTGKRELWRRFIPADPTGILTLRSLLVTPDGKHYAYTTRRVLSTVYAIDGLP